MRALALAIVLLFSILRPVSNGPGFVLAVLGTVVLAGTNADASLRPSADGKTIYDSTLKVTWLADANLAATETFGVEGINPGGLMSWNTAQNWVAAMNAANYLGHHNWRLPATKQPDAACTQKTSLGSFAYHCTGSEMGALFYHELGGAKGISVLQARSPSLRLFRNFQPYLYWSGTVYPVVGKSSWSFSFGNGFEGTNLNANAMYAIPLFSETGGRPPSPPANEGIGVVPHVNAKPSLEASGNGRTVYDRALNVTWLADANLAATQTFGVKGINPNGSMSWHTAQHWIAAINAAHYLGRGDWRLPNTPQPDDSCSIIRRNSNREAATTARAVKWANCSTRNWEARRGVRLNAHIIASGIYFTISSRTSTGPKPIPNCRVLERGRSPSGTGSRAAISFPMISM